MTVIRDIIERQAQTTRRLSNENVAAGVRSYRYERKFLVENSRLQTVEGVVQLHPAPFYRIYKPRFINNIYLDTPHFLNYRNSLDGIANRIKARIRWYGDLFASVCSPRLEIKGKEDSVSYKSVYPLNDFEFSHKTDAEFMLNLFEVSAIPSDISNYLSYTRPVFVNRYRRKYWLSGDERYRLTLDHNIWFCGFTFFGLRELKRISEDTSVILEIKYSLKDDEHFADVANKFPFRQTKSSKFMVGMDQLYQLGN